MKPSFLVCLICLILQLAVAKNDEYLDMLNEKLKNVSTSDNAIYQLRLLRNEIFARHGKAFNSPDLKAYFSKQNWYKINLNYHDSLLTIQEKETLKKIQSFEAKGSDTLLPIKMDGISHAIFFPRFGKYSSLNEMDIVNSTFNEINLNINDTLKWRILLSITSRQSQGYGVDGYSGNGTIECYKIDYKWKSENSGIIDNGHIRKLLWKTSFFGYRASIIADEIIGIDNSGCGGELSYKELYSIKNGKFILQCTNDPICISESYYSPIKFIAYCDNSRFDSLTSHKAPDNSYGMLYFANADSIIDMISISVTESVKFRSVFYLNKHTPFEIESNGVFRNRCDSDSINKISGSITVLTEKEKGDIDIPFDWSGFRIKDIKKYRNFFKRLKKMN